MVIFVHNSLAASDDFFRVKFLSQRLWIFELMFCYISPYVGGIY